MLSHCRIITRTCADLATFREGGGLARRRMSFGVGWLDSMSRPVPSYMSLMLRSPFKTPHLSRASRTRNSHDTHNPISPAPAGINCCCCPSQWNPIFKECTRNRLTTFFGTKPEPRSAAPWILLLHGSKVYGEKERTIFRTQRDRGECS